MKLFVIVLFLLSLALPAHSGVRIPNVLSDHMVLQQNTDVTLWGWTSIGDTVQVETSWGQKAETKSTANGAWSLKIHTPPACPLSQGLHPETITFAMPGENMIQIKDILIGEVWLCSGQSNMEMMLRPGYPPGWNAWFGEAFWSTESKNTNRPYLRVFDVEKTAASTPQDDVKGRSPSKGILVPNAQGFLPDVIHGWAVCTPQSAEYFSAVAYYFGTTLAEKLQVPIGLITSDVGGTAIDRWMKGGDLYNGMIAPFFPMTLRGVIWYQGESNVGNAPGNYTAQFTSMIQDWRQNFHHPDLPFYFVQIAPCGNNGAAGQLRDDQAQTLAVKNTGMAVTNDIGDPNDVHPKNKRDVGRRLAWQALRKTYGETNVIADGPTFDSLQFQNGKITVNFRDIGGGLIARDGKPLTCFAVAAADGNFVPAQAEIANNQVVVTCPPGQQSTEIRFAWGPSDQPNLMSKDGLPAAQFQAPLK